MSLAAVFVPGIMGTELKLPSGEVVWPPKVTETIFGYNRIDKLQSPDLRATEVIRNVSCVDFYSPILALFREMGFAAQGAKRLVEHPYDWRRDLFDLADDLADMLDTVDADEIVLVAHSMGGLITRLMLETGTYAGRPFFHRISGFFALATPHNGAPLALARVMGLDKALGISREDFKKLSANPAYPSGYQLLPAPGEDACWDTTNGSKLKPLDFYDPQVAARLGMKPALVARARAVHDALNAGAAPTHIRYFYFSGAGHKTVTRVNMDGQTAFVVQTPDAGDGTVPMWSSLPRTEQKQVVINEHANVFRGTPFKRVFFRLFGADAGAPLEAPVFAGLEGTEPEPVRISLQKPVFGEDEPIELVLTSETLMTALEGRLVFDRITEADAVEAEAAAAEEVLYRGPGINALAMTLKTRLSPGFYELRFEGDRPLEERVVVAISR
ncbi:esterase/lipase family protein [Salipiger sp.]|uniref:esterase/lipase family protein n=1 Tax=Salipiger sp. TaxID=2078585 RepID=UPI003A972266